MLLLLCLTWCADLAVVTPLLKAFCIPLRWDKRSYLICLFPLRLSLRVAECGLSAVQGLVAAGTMTGHKKRSCRTRAYSVLYVECCSTPCESPKLCSISPGSAPGVASWTARHSSKVGIRHCNSAKDARNASAMHLKNSCGFAVVLLNLALALGNNEVRNITVTL